MHISETPRDLWRVQGIDPRQRILRQKSLGRQRITHIPTKLSILSDMIALSIETIEEPISYMITTILRSSSNIAPSENL